MASNLPPGCTSPDGGIDHALEAAAESLCMEIQTPEQAIALQALLPGLAHAMSTQYAEGHKDGELETEQRLQSWINDLQSGMYINCVYCGHRYGPKTEVPATMADVLKKHIEQCPKHPLSQARAEIDRLQATLHSLVGGPMPVTPESLRRAADCLAARVPTAGEYEVERMRAVIDALPEALNLEYPLDHQPFRDAFAKFDQAPEWIKQMAAAGGNGGE